MENETRSVKAGGETTVMLKRRNSDTVGVWINNEPQVKVQGDVHIYHQRDAMVIGNNVDLNDNIDYTDIALIAEGWRNETRTPAEFRLQTVGKNPEVPDSTRVPDHVVREEIKYMLMRIKQRVGK